MPCSNPWGTPITSNPSRRHILLLSTQSPIQIVATKDDRPLTRTSGCSAPKETHVLPESMQSLCLTCRQKLYPNSFSHLRRCEILWGKEYHATGVDLYRPSCFEPFKDARDYLNLREPGCNRCRIAPCAGIYACNYRVPPIARRTNSRRTSDISHDWRLLRSSFPAGILTLQKVH